MYVGTKHPSGMWQVFAVMLSTTDSLASQFLGELVDTDCKEDPIEII